MNVYVVVTRFMQGSQDNGVFATREAAESHARSLGPNGNPDVVECSVFGASPEQTKVYVGSYYDPISDVHLLEGVYGTFEAAKGAAGDKGLVLERTIEH